MQIPEKYIHKAESSTSISQLFRGDKRSIAVLFTNVRQTELNAHLKPSRASIFGTLFPHECVFAGAGCLAYRVHGERRYICGALYVSEWKA